MSLSVLCDHCGEEFFRWRFDRKQQEPPTIELYRRHSCPKCATAEEKAHKELKEWAQKSLQTHKQSYDEKFEEVFKKFRRN